MTEMIKLYRGIVDILLAQLRSQCDAFAKHIRSGCTEKTMEPNDFGVAGFWNLLLEVSFISFTMVTYFFGLLGTMLLALIFFPLYAIKQSVVNILNHRAEPFQEPNYIEPK